MSSVSKNLQFWEELAGGHAAKPRPASSDHIRGSEDEIAPSLPPRPSNDVPPPLPRRVEETKPTLPERPKPQAEDLKKPRPVVPPKSKSVAGRLATVKAPEDSNRITLVDLEEDDSNAGELLLLEPEPEAEQEQEQFSNNASDRAETADSNALDIPTPPLPPRRKSSPLGAVPDKLFRTVSQGAQVAVKHVSVEAPKAWQGVAGGAQKAVKGVQTEAPKAWQGVAKGTQNAVKGVQTEAPKAFKTAANQTQKVFSDVHSGIARTVNGIPVPRAFAETREDFFDLTRLQLGQPGICSRCATLPLDKCFTETINPDEEAYIPWSTPLSRICLHAKWCRLCGLLLSILCRTEHDPLLLSEIRNYIEPEWLRGAPLSAWVNEGYIYQDKYWPFGRSDLRHEGSTQVVGPFADVMWEFAKQYSTSGIRILTRSAIRGRADVRLEDFKIKHTHTYAKGYQRGKKAGSRYPISCVVLITVSAKHADAPGLLWVDLIGCSNAPGAEEKVLSHFMLQAVKNGLSVNVTPDLPLSYGHKLDPQWIDVSMGKLWLSECETRHGTKCGQHGWAVAMQKPTFLRLLDIKDLSIIVADDPSTCRYIALSYVWGGANMVKLRHENLESLSKPRGLEQCLPALPQTVIDAMEVVKSLGERYLWVDALCILQEDTRESHEQIASMDAVYGSALLTIVAAGGNSADAGLRGVRRQHFVQADKPGLEREILQPVATMKNSVDILAPLTIQQNVERSHWNSRAWTFQERLLSRRLLIFADNQMDWHCRCMVAKEDVSADESGVQNSPLEWLNLKPQYLGVGIDSHWTDGSFEVTRHRLTHVVRSGTFAEYAKMIEQYSSRNVTYESDAVNALSGLLRIFSLCFESECIFGLPTILLDVALLWRPLEPLKRRSESTNFPSWSWAAWKGRVAYDRPVRIRRDESGQLMETEGIRPLLRYYLFDRHTGSLQPLNGTSRGLPMAEDEIPPEWEAHAAIEGCYSNTHTCRIPDLFDLDPRTIPQLSNRHHLLFWTSSTSAFTLGNLPPQRIDEAWLPGSPPNRRSILDYDGSQVGNVLLNSSDFLQIDFDHHEFLLIAEAHTSLEDGETLNSDYGFYLVMLVATNPQSGISERLGIGRVVKDAWIMAHPGLKLICLG